MFIKPNKTVLRRGLLVLGGALLLWILLIIRLFYLQVLSYDDYHKLVIDNITSETTITAPRGLIYDCNMTPIAINVQVERVFISPCDIQSEEEKVLVSQGLSEILDVDYDTIYEKAGRYYRMDETIKNNVEEEKADEVRAFINEHKLTCIHLAETSKRYYPFGTLASQVIGFVGAEGKGAYGIELEYDTYLQGVSGKIITAVNARGGSMPTKYESYIDAESGYNIVSTLDYKIQSTLDSYLEETFYENKVANRVCGIVMNVNTGAILAMGTYPNFDLNTPNQLDEWSLSQISQYGEGTEEYQEKYNEYLLELWRNKAISYLYEPGSTFKVVTAAMGFEENVVTPTDMFTCTGSYAVDLGNGHTQNVSCHRTTGHGTVTFARGLQQSCNPTMMQLAKRIGVPSFYKYFEAFGYTEKTGIDLPGESAGIYSTQANMHNLELAIYAFGQTFKTTAIQQITAISAVANGGTLVTPHVVSKLVDDDGNVIKSFEPETRRTVISEETAKIVTDILQEGVSTDGGAKNAYVKGYKVAAKTGTSQKRDKLSESGEDIYRVGSCIAYAPAENPQVAILIVVDEPFGNSVYGSMVAAPYVSKTMGEVLAYMNIDPVYTEEELLAVEVSVTNYTGMSITEAKAALESAGIKYKVYGSGETVNDQMPRSGSIMSKESGTVLLYTGDAAATGTVEVPDLTDMTISQANYALTTAGLNIRLTGAVQSSAAGAKAVSQSVAPGTVVPYGTTVTVNFLYINVTDG